MAALAAFFIVSSLPATAAQKRALVDRGIFGAAIARMDTIVKGLKAKGYSVDVREWYEPLPSVTYDVTVSHSAGVYRALRAGRLNLSIDPPILSPACASGTKCKNWHNFLDALPFIFCCGGYPVYGAENIEAPAGHVQMPETVAADVLRAVP